MVRQEGGNEGRFEATKQFSEKVPKPILVFPRLCIFCPAKERDCPTSGERKGKLRKQKELGMLEIGHPMVLQVVTSESSGVKVKAVFLFHLPLFQQ